MNIVVSVGEVIDKLSILELKHRFITDEEKLREVAREIDELCCVFSYKNTVYYECLMSVNESIWKMTDIIKTKTLQSTEYAEVAHRIFEYNQQRFRIKNIFNRALGSVVKEQKSYAAAVATISKKDVMEGKNILQLTLEYDIIYVDDLEYMRELIPMAVDAGVICRAAA